LTTEERQKITEMDKKLIDLKDRVISLQVRRKKFLENIQARDDKQMELPL